MIVPPADADPRLWSLALAASIGWFDLYGYRGDYETALAGLIEPYYRVLVLRESEGERITEENAMLVLARLLRRYGRRRT